MITASFERNWQGMRSVEVSGHAGFADYGQDIVCAAVTSALQMAVNAVVEVLQVPAELVVEENRIYLRLPADIERYGRCSVSFLEALYLHLDLLSKDYGDNLLLSVKDV